MGSEIGKFGGYRKSILACKKEGCALVISSLKIIGDTTEEVEDNLYFASLHKVKIIIASRGISLYLRTADGDEK